MTPQQIPLASCLIVAMTIGSACSRGDSVPRAAEEATIVPVAAQAAERGRIRAVIHVSGVVVPAQGAEFLVIAPEPARVLEITKAAGDVVAPGELLVRFELPSATGELGRQRAEVARLQAEAENARIAQMRMRDLVERGLVPRVQMDRADRELADAEAALRVAEAAREAAEALAERARVTAPFAGLVTSVLHAPGDLVQASPADPVLRVVDPTRLEVVATIPRGDVARVTPGASARLVGAVEGRDVPLSVSGGPDLANAGADGSVRVRLSLPEQAGVTVDMPVQVDIDAEEREDAIFLTPGAIAREGGEDVVYIAEGDVARRRVVTTGVAEEQRIEIVSGVQPGDLVITRGQAGLSDGARISVAADTR